MSSSEGKFGFMSHPTIAVKGNLVSCPTHPTQSRGVWFHVTPILITIFIPLLSSHHFLSSRDFHLKMRSLYSNPPSINVTMNVKTWHHNSKVRYQDCKDSFILYFISHHNSTSPSSLFILSSSCFFVFFC